MNTRGCESFTQNACLKKTFVNQPAVQPASSKILDNVLNMGSTIAKILTICGVDNAKATKAVSSITHAFLHFDENQVGDYGLCKTRHMRKEDLLKSLCENCCMSDTEARLAVSVVKCAFRAFYHKQSIRKYDPAFYTEEDWTQAAGRTIEAYAKAGATKSELELAATRIQEAYKGYLNRVSYKRAPNVNENACDALHRVNCYSCSTKNDPRNSYTAPNGPRNSYAAPNQVNQQNLPQQVICQCCGCLKRSGVSPVSYRDGKGRSILLVEDNNMYYNTQVMKQEIDNLQQATCVGQSRDPCEGNLSRALFKLTRDMVNRIIKNGGKDDSNLEGTPSKLSNINFDQTENSKKNDQDCDCDTTNKVKHRRRRSTARSSSDDVRRGYGSTPPNSPSESYDRKKRRSSNPADTDAIVEIALKGVCRRSSNGRARIDVVGLRLLDNEYGGPSEFVCKKRVRVTNRYTQTGGSAGVSACSSSSSAGSASGKRRSSASGKSRPSRMSGKRKPSFGDAIQHNYPMDGDDDQTLIETKMDATNDEAQANVEVEEIYVKQQRSSSAPGDAMAENLSADIENIADDTGAGDDTGEAEHIDEVVEAVEEVPADDVGHESNKEENMENVEELGEPVAEQVEE